MKTINENGTFRKRSPEWIFLKTLFPCGRVDRRKRNFSKTLTSHYQLQSTPSNIRNKMADGRFPFLSFLLGLISNLVACFQANLALLIIQADYSRRRQNIVVLLSPPVSRGIASSMRSRVSYSFQIDSSYTFGRAKTMRKRYEYVRTGPKFHRSCN